MLKALIEQQAAGRLLPSSKGAATRVEDDILQASARSGVLPPQKPPAARTLLRARAATASTPSSKARSTQAAPALLRPSGSVSPNTARWRSALIGTKSIRAAGLPSESSATGGQRRAHAQTEPLLPMSAPAASASTMSSSASSAEPYEAAPIIDRDRNGGGARRSNESLHAGLDSTTIAAAVLAQVNALEQRIIAAEALAASRTSEMSGSHPQHSIAVQAVEETGEWAPVLADDAAADNATIVDTSRMTRDTAPAPPPLSFAQHSDASHLRSVPSSAASSRRSSGADADVRSSSMAAVRSAAAAAGAAAAAAASGAVAHRLLPPTQPVSHVRRPSSASSAPPATGLLAHATYASSSNEHMSASAVQADAAAAASCHTTSRASSVASRSSSVRSSSASQQQHLDAATYEAKIGAAALPIAHAPNAPSAAAPFVARDERILPLARAMLSAARDSRVAEASAISAAAALKISGYPDAARAAISKGNRADSQGALPSPPPQQPPFDLHFCNGAPRCRHGNADAPGMPHPSAGFRQTGGGYTSVLAEELRAALAATAKTSAPARPESTAQVAQPPREIPQEATRKERASPPLANSAALTPDDLAVILRAFGENLSASLAPRVVAALERSSLPPPRGRSPPRNNDLDGLNPRRRGKSAAHSSLSNSDLGPLARSRSVSRAPSAARERTHHQVDKAVTAKTGVATSAGIDRSADAQSVLMAPPQRTLQETADAVARYAVRVASVEERMRRAQGVLDTLQRAGAGAMRPLRAPSRSRTFESVTPVAAAPQAAPSFLKNTVLYSLMENSLVR